MLCLNIGLSTYMYGLDSSCQLLLHNSSSRFCAVRCSLPVCTTMLVSSHHDTALFWSTFQKVSRDINHCHSSKKTEGRLCVPDTLRATGQEINKSQNCVANAILTISFGEPYTKRSGRYNPSQNKDAHIHNYHSMTYVWTQLFPFAISVWGKSCYIPCSNWYVFCL